MPSLRLARVDVREMDLSKWNGDACQRVVYRKTRVAVGTGVDEGPVSGAFQCVNRVDDVAFPVELGEADSNIQLSRHFAQSRFDLGKRGRSVDRRLALSQEIEVRSVDDRNSHVSANPSSHSRKRRI